MCKQEALLSIGGEAHVTVSQCHGVCTRNSLFTQALQIKRHLFLPLSQLHARIERPRPEHGTQALFEQGHIDLRHPGADCIAIIVQDTDQRKGQVTGLRSLHVDRRATHGTGFRKVKVRKIGVMAWSPSGFRHMQS